MSQTEWVPIGFLDEEIEPWFDKPPLLSKKPDPPDGFSWRGETHRVGKLLSTWVDYGRKGRMAKNMQPHNLRRAAQQGSWGVGKFYFRVMLQDGRVFDLYYDRAPGNAGDRAGKWILWRELQAS
jgi:hypothetical protein